MSALFSLTISLIFLWPLRCLATFLSSSSATTLRDRGVLRGENSFVMPALLCLPLGAGIHSLSLSRFGRSSPGAWLLSQSQRAPLHARAPTLDGPGASSAASHSSDALSQTQSCSNSLPRGMPPTKVRRMSEWTHSWSKCSALAAAAEPMARPGRRFRGSTQPRALRLPQTRGKEHPGATSARFRVAPRPSSPSQSRAGRTAAGNG